MSSDAMLGYGSKYEIKIAGVFKLMGEVIAIEPGQESAERVQVTHMQSPNRRHEYIAGMTETGEGNFQINWVPGSETDTDIRTLRASGEVTEHRITFPNGQRVTYDAIVSAFSKALPIEDRMTATVTVIISGDETWDAEAVPTNLVTPSIVGASVQVGVTLTAVEGEYENAPDSYSYQWQHDASGNGTFANVSVGGASKTYVPVVGDVADFLRVGVTPSNGAGAGTTVYSLPVGPIIAA